MDPKSIGLCPPEVRIPSLSTRYSCDAKGDSCAEKGTAFMQLPQSCRSGKLKDFDSAGAQPDSACAAWPSAIEVRAANGKLGDSRWVSLIYV